MQYRDNPIMAYWRIVNNRKVLMCRICVYRSMLIREEDNDRGNHQHLCNPGTNILFRINRMCCIRHSSISQQRRIKPLFKFNNNIHEIAATWDECHICEVCQPRCKERMKIYQELYRQVIDQTPRDKD